MQYENFKHNTKIQIRFKDVDKMGHVNNANHFTYCEIARTEYFKQVFDKYKPDWEHTGIILAKAEMEYKLPILFHDDLYCFTKVTRLGGKSFDIENVLAKLTEKGLVLLAKGKFIMVCMNYKENLTIDIPTEWREDMEKFEGDL